MLLAISGPSTVGKDSTWVPIAETLGFRREIPYTTRQMRQGEVNHGDHHYVSTETFHGMIRDGGLAEWDFVLGNYYGPSTSLRDRLAAGEDVVLQVLGRMALRLKRALPQVCTLMLTTSGRETLEQRLRHRGYSGDTLILRVLHGTEELTHAPLFDFVVPDADIMTDIEITRTLLDIIVSQHE